MNHETSHIFSDVFKDTLTSYISQHKKILIINNKKWYASGYLCRQCGYIPKCRSCDVPIAVYLDTHGIHYSMCHICKTTYPNPVQCNVCQGAVVTDYGMGNQKLAERIWSTMYVNALIVDSQHTRSLAKIKHVHSLLATHNVVIATNIMTRPCFGWTADVIVVFNADSALQIPDFDTDRKQFYVLYELLTAHHTTNYIIQTHNPTHPVYQYLCSLDLGGFDQRNKVYMQTHDYPPYGELCLISYKHQIEERLFGKINTLYQELMYLREKIQSDIEIYATPPLIYKIYNTYRYHIILKGSKIRDFVDYAYKTLDIRSKWFRIDRKPVSLVGS